MQVSLSLIVSAQWIFKYTPNFILDPSSKPRAAEYPVLPLSSLWYSPILYSTHWLSSLSSCKRQGDLCSHSGRWAHRHIGPTACEALHILPPLPCNIRYNNHIDPDNFHLYSSFHCCNASFCHTWSGNWMSRRNYCTHTSCPGTAERWEADDACFWQRVICYLVKWFTLFPGEKKDF